MVEKNNDRLFERQTWCVSFRRRWCIQQSAPQTDRISSNVVAGKSLFSPAIHPQNFENSLLSENDLGDLNSSSTDRQTAGWKSLTQTPFLFPIIVNNVFVTKLSFLRCLHFWQFCFFRFSTFQGFQCVLIFKRGRQRRIRAGGPARARKSWRKDDAATYTNTKLKIWWVKNIAILSLRAYTYQLGRIVI